MKCRTSFNVGRKQVLCNVAIKAPIRGNTLPECIPLKTELTWLMMSCAPKWVKFCRRIKKLCGNWIAKILSLKSGSSISESSNRKKFSVIFFHTPSISFSCDETRRQLLQAATASLASRECCSCRGFIRIGRYFNIKRKKKLFFVDYIFLLYLAFGKSFVNTEAHHSSSCS